MDEQLADGAGDGLADMRQLAHAVPPTRPSLLLGERDLRLVAERVSDALASRHKNRCA